MDFTWYYFIGGTKLGIDYNKVGRLTLTLFNKLYKHYKNEFDKELLLTANKITYAEATKRTYEEQEWF